jgi:hypothetical protein
MTKRCNNRVRSRGKLVLNSYNRMVAHYVYGQISSKWRDWTFRTISLRQAEIKEAAGEVERVMREVDGVVQCVGFLAKNATIQSNPTPATLTLATLNAVSNRDGRLTRGEELQVIRFLAWPMIGDTRATCVRPPMTATERRYAEKVLAAGRLQVA